MWAPVAMLSYAPLVREHQHPGRTPPSCVQRRQQQDNQSRMDHGRLPR